jgi:hypothetical protein
MVNVEPSANALEGQVDNFAKFKMNAAFTSDSEYLASSALARGATHASIMAAIRNAAAEHLPHRVVREFMASVGWM